jgi:antirestriction protein ArdC
LVEGAGVPVVHGGSEAFYDPANDRITLPPRFTFADERAYYATAFHELAHATGHPSRLGRDLSGRWGSDAYAMEELVGELTSGFVGGVFGIESIADTAAYMASWLRVLRSDSRAFFSVTSQATKASDYLLRHQVSESE